MPLIDVTYDGSLDEEVLRRLGDALPRVVGEAVECPEDPVTGPEQPGDIEIRFRKRSPLDVGGLDVASRSAPSCSSTACWISSAGRI